MSPSRSWTKTGVLSAAGFAPRAQALEFPTDCGVCTGMKRSTRPAWKRYCFVQNSAIMYCRPLSCAVLQCIALCCAILHCHAL